MRHLALRCAAVAVMLALVSAPAAAQTGAAAPATPTSPLAIHVGDADLLFGGFLDATIATRSAATGAGLPTSFGTIPFGNTPQGNLGEMEFSAQNSRLSLQATSAVKSASVKGYIEVDFLGTAPNSINVTSNSNTLRMRLYWAQITRGKFEFLAGQSWSLLMPNRRGLSPMPADLFFTQDVDSNYQAGLTWTRATQFRFIAHPGETFSAGLALENPEQYVGSAVVLPAAFPAFEVNTGSVTTTTPNRHMDFIGKVAYDPATGATHQHLEAAILVRGFKTYDPVADHTFGKTAVGGSIGARIEPVKNLNLVSTAFFSDGGGRYIANVNGPDLIVNSDASVTLVKSRSAIGGAEYTAGKTMVFGYYSGATFDRTLTSDVDGKPIGYGVEGSAAANHTLREGTAGLVETFFRDPKVGGLQAMLQYSKLTRTPFSVPAGTPSDAAVHMVYVNVRYILP